MRYVDWRQDDAGDRANLVGLCVRKSEGYRHENEVRLLFWAPLTEPVPVPGAQPDAGASINVEQVARGVLAQLAKAFPSADFSTVDGKLLVVEAWQKQRWRQQFLELARKVARHYGLTVNVHSSELRPPTRPPQ